MLVLSMLLTVIKSPVLCIQYLRAKAIAKKMLLNGYEPELSCAE